MTIIQNNANVEAIGKEAARRWGLRDEHGSAGDANAICALVYADRTMTFTANVQRKDSVETFDFDVKSLATPLFNNDGTKDTKAMSARTDALLLKLFGIEERTNAINTSLARCIKSAVYLIDAVADVELDALIGFKDADGKDVPGIVSMKAAKLVVPYGLVMKAPAEDASDNDKAVYEVMKEKPLVLDGKNGASLAELGKRANPPKAKRAAGDSDKGNDQGASFAGSLEFVRAIVQQNSNPDADESEVALSDELRRNLFALAQDIAAYFAIDPLEDAEVEGERAAA